MEGEAYAGAGLLKGASVHGRPTLKLSVSEGLHLMEGIHGAGGVCEELQSTERIHVGEVHEGVCSMEGTKCWNRGRLWEGRIIKML